VLYPLSYGGAGPA